MLPRFPLKLLIIFTVNLFYYYVTFAQTFQWVKQIGGTSADYVNTIYLDDSGNIFTTGRFGGTCDFDPGPGTFNLTSGGNADGYISKLNAAGDFVWAKPVVGSSTEKVNSIITSSNGDIYVTGRFSYTTDFDNGPGVFNMTAVGGYDIFIMKLNSSGMFLWASQMGGLLYDEGVSIVLDGDENIYITGIFEGTADLDPGVGSFNITSNGETDIFISKLNPAGNFLWTKSIGGSSFDNCYSLKFDSGGNYYMVGNFELTVDADPGSGSSLLNSAGLSDFFIIKFDSLDNFSWSKGIGGIDGDFASEIAVDSSGNLYVTGGFSFTVDFDPGSGIFNVTSNGSIDAYVLCLDALGNFKWVKSFGGTLTDYCTDIETDNKGKLYTTGQFEDIVDFDPGAAIFSYNSLGGWDAFICILDTLGDYVWSKQIGGTSYDYGNDLALNDNENIYLAGEFRDTTNFDLPFSTSISSYGLDDVFIAKYGDCSNTIGFLAINSCDYYVSPSGIYTWTVSGNYYDTISNAAGCDSIIIINLTITEIDTSVSQNGINLSSNETGSTYQWLDCGNGFSPIPGETGQNFTPLSNGNYAVALSKNGCVDTSFCHAVTSVGIGVSSIHSGVSIFPNPCDQSFTVTSTSQRESLIITITNLTGKIIRKEILNYTCQKSINVSDLAEGIYLVKVEGERFYGARKLVVIH